MNMNAILSASDLPISDRDIRNWIAPTDQQSATLVKRFNSQRIKNARSFLLVVPELAGR